MRNASINNTCVGVKKFANGVTQCCWTMNGIVEPATNETVKNTIIKTGSARKPTIRVRLAPMAPYGFAESIAASVAKNPPNERTNPPPIMSPIKAKKSG